MGRSFWGGSILAGLVLALLGYLAFQTARPSIPVKARTTLSVSEVMGGEVEGIPRAFEPRSFSFPEDHGPHPEFRTEWWYLTGNLESGDGENFGFQFTVFRNALGSPPPISGSSWATNQVFMGHLAITDGENGDFFSFERFSRGALGLAGARSDPFRVWLEDWVLEGPPDGGLFPLRVTGIQNGVGVELELRSPKPMVLQGDQGLSQKGPEPGNASYYYSFTRLDAEGAVSVGGEEVRVSGHAWLDREWSTSALSEGQVGWDWFALQLTDGRDLMYYQLRLADGAADPLSKGVLVSPTGMAQTLPSADVTLSVDGFWESPIDGTRYPSAWRLSEASSGLELRIRPLIPNQELDLTFRYWEGAVLVEGRDSDGPVEGRGYVELTGYSQPAGRGGDPATDVHATAGPLPKAVINQRTLRKPS